ncbi:MAG: hypothetical protein ISS36_01895 [Candidatus Aenigmarchaeota archaeon]|nr:hypothetical protein [Candidatus Aenigmarchaeota archaeon]
MKEKKETKNENGIEFLLSKVNRLENIVNKIKPAKIPRGINKTIEELQSDVVQIKSSITQLEGFREEIKDIENLENELGIGQKNKSGAVIDEIELVKDRIKNLEKLEDVIFNSKESIRKTKEILDSVKMRVESIDVKNTEEGLQRELSDMNETIIELARKNSEMDKRLSDIEEFSSGLKPEDIENLKNEIFAMRMELQRVNTKAEKLNLDPIYRRMSEIDSKIKVIRANSPVVIE